VKKSVNLGSIISFQMTSSHCGQSTSVLQFQHLQNGSEQYLISLKLGLWD